jgi:hypothetical protein
MAQNEHANQPSSKALWFIVPIAIGLSLLLTNLEHTPPKPTLSGKVGEMKKETAPVAEPVAQPAADTTHSETPAADGHAH